jgi:hypothetical protein
MSILRAVRNPVVVKAGQNGVKIYKGADGTTVVVNKLGKVITTYGVPRG